MRKLIYYCVLICISLNAFALSLEQPINFNNDALGLYTSEDFEKDWGLKPNESSGVGSRLNIVYDPDNDAKKALEVTYLANQVGGKSAMTFTAPLNGKYSHLFLQYRVRFSEDFTFVKGGKLPGLTSAPDSPTGCIENNSFDGFSARYMWREEGLLYGYIYNPTKQEKCGDYFPTSPPLYFQKNQWYTLKQEIYLGDPGVANGYIKAWVNGGLVIDIPNILLRNQEDIYIDEIKMDTFFGGSSEDWAPETDQKALFSDFTISLEN